MRVTIENIEAEYRRYRRLGTQTLEQLTEEQLKARVTPESNSVSTIVWHLSGNLTSRFTDFLTTDGEKSWREREDEFAIRGASYAEVRTKWDEGWDVLAGALVSLTDQDLDTVVSIRGVELSVREALLRSLAHTSYHVGQMVFIGKALSGERWSWLSIPPGGTAEYNRDPSLEKG